MKHPRHFLWNLLVLFAGTILLHAQTTQAPASGAQDQQERPEQWSLKGLSLPGETRATAQDTPACPNNICPGLGNAFYLPTINARTINSGGTIFLRDRKLGSCAALYDQKANNRDFNSDDSMAHLVSKSMSEAELSGSYQSSVLSMSGTAKVMSGYSADITTTFHSTHMDIFVITHSVDLQQDSRCMSQANLDPAFLARFQSLALISTPAERNSAAWDPYIRFLKDLGSHIVIQQLIGSRFQQWESSSSTDSDIETTLKAKACAEAEGTGAGGWSVAGCGAYDSEERKRAMRAQAESRRVILGGTDAARAALTKDVNKKNLDDFIDAALKGNQPVRFVYKPIWYLLYAIYEPACASAGAGSDACKNLQRAVTLEAAYEDWTAVGCSPAADGHGWLYQWMRIAGTTSLGINTYECMVSKMGCYTSDDCHLGGAGSVCYCYGQSCIDQGEKITDPTTTSPMFRGRVRGNKEGSYNEGVNNSCYYTWGPQCKCDSGWSGGLPLRAIYSQSAPAMKQAP